MSYQEGIDALRKAVEESGMRTRQWHRNEWPTGWAAIDSLLREDRDKDESDIVVADEEPEPDPVPEPMEVTLDEDGDVVSARVLKVGEGLDFVDTPDDEAEPSEVGRHADPIDPEPDKHAGYEE